MGEENRPAAFNVFVKVDLAVGRVRGEVLRGTLGCQSAALRFGLSLRDQLRGYSCAVIV